MKQWQTYMEKSSSEEEGSLQKLLAAALKEKKSGEVVQNQNVKQKNKSTKSTKQKQTKKIPKPKSNSSKLTTPQKNKNSDNKKLSIHSPFSPFAPINIEPGAAKSPNHTILQMDKSTLAILYHQHPYLFFFFSTRDQLFPCRYRDASDIPFLPSPPFWS